MNKSERNAIVEMKVLLAELKTDIKYIRNSVREHNKKIDEVGDKLIIVENNLNNHLQEHERLRKEMFTKLGMLVSAIGVISSVVLKFVFG